jgi:hypothetical protein
VADFKIYVNSITWYVKILSIFESNNKSNN